MQVNIIRKTVNNLYSEGILFINDARITSTLEASATALPAGNYTIRIIKHSARKQSINLFTPETKCRNSKPSGEICTGHSWRECKASGCILIGSPLVPGVLYKASATFARLSDRIAKAMQRGEEITLTISDEYARQNVPPRMWNEPPHHYCSPTRLRVDADDDGNITVLYPDGRSRHFELKDAKG